MSDLDNVSAPQDQRTLALVAHLLGIITGPIGALVIWLISKDDANKGFVTDQAKEALNFQITMLIAFVVALILTVVLIGALLMPLLGIANLVLCIIAGLKANNGEAYRYPFALRLIG